MKSRPQFSLCSLFVIFICASIGLTFGLAPPPPNNSVFVGIYVAQFNWYYALLSAASVAVLIGLAQQICVLLAFRTSIRNHKGFQFAVDFAVIWRILIGILILVCLTVRLLERRGIVELPHGDGVFSFEAFPASVWLLSIILVFSEAICRRSPGSNSLGQPTWISTGAWIAATVLALILLPNTSLIHFLVHIATAGIESNIPSPFQRLGTFPNHQAEGYRVFWTSTAAVLSVVLAGYVWQTIGGINRPWKFRLPRATAFIALLVFAAVLCMRFLDVELERISPDLAGGGFSGSWLDLTAGAGLAAIFVTVWAARLSRQPEKTATIGPSIVRNVQGTFFHESVFCVASALLASVVFYVELGMMISSFSGVVGSGISLTDLAYSFLSDASNYLQLALIIASGTLGVLIWRQRGTKVPWRISVLSAKAFVANWIAIAILALIAIPTICIYCFTFWLGPWYRFWP